VRIALDLNDRGRSKKGKARNAALKNASASLWITFKGGRPDAGRPERQISFPRSLVRPVPDCFGTLDSLLTRVRTMLVFRMAATVCAVVNPDSRGLGPLAAHFDGYRRDIETDLRHESFEPGCIHRLGLR